MEQLPFQEFEADDIENWKTKLRDRVALARNWEHINSLARDHGLRLAEGWALHDGTNYLRLSSIDGVSLKRRQALLRETYSEYVLRNSKSRDNNEQKHDEDRKFKRIDRSFDISDDRER
ncbi:MAG: hypothetical protein JJ964_16470 [Rhizobiales bacterium]|nr:hypothetical protein [Hyphomicrobiales bacterium]